MFLAFPLNSKPDWRNPPLVTFLLILINCIVFFGPQRAEERAWEQATDYYAGSRLPSLELPRYAEHLRTSSRRDGERWAQRIEDALAKRQVAGPLRMMEHDGEFMKRLRAGQVIRPDSADYAVWHEQRQRFEQARGAPFVERWASNPADWNPVSLVSAAFLHGSLAHLLGNMVFLFAFGFTVEMSLGRARYLLFYLLAGAGGDVGQLLTHWNTPGLSLGASGAISGLMAMYAMLYGLRRIRFFYQFLFYFDYVKAPAIILLPVWIGHEFFQQWLNPNAGIAYMAHAGGLITGALLLAWHKWRHPAVTARLPEDAPVDPAPALQARAEAALRAMKTDEARRLYGELAGLRPTDRQAIAAWFNLAKLVPTDESFHRAAARLFALPGDDEGLDTLIHDAYLSYMSTARPPRLGTEQMARLALRFAKSGREKEAERLYRLLAAREGGHDRLPTILLALVRARLARGDREGARAHVAILAREHAGSDEARLAATMVV